MAPLNLDQLSRIAAFKPARRRDDASPAETSLDSRSRRTYVNEPNPAVEFLCQKLGAFPQRNARGEHLVIQKFFFEPSCCDTTFPALRLLAPDAPEDAADPSTWLFLDTETTGLAGGTGTYPFLIGLAWWDSGGLQVEQFFMRDHADEHSVLLALQARMAERPVLVTFNGKTFDWPLIQTRYRMTRSLSAPSPRAHLDFLHPSRQLWRLRIGSVRLSELERHILGRNRGPDIVSELIPQIYFDFLCGGSPEPLMGVLYHNQMDLVGLAALSGRVFSLLAEADQPLGDSLEMFGVSRICHRRGEKKRARKLYSEALKGKLPKPADTEARTALAHLARVEGDFNLATSLWADLKGGSPTGIAAYENLAKYYEHRARTPERAAELINDALAELRRSRNSRLLTAGQYAKLYDRLQRRLARLQAKLSARATQPRFAATASEPLPLT